MLGGLGKVKTYKSESLQKECGQEHTTRVTISFPEKYSPRRPFPTSLIFDSPSAVREPTETPHHCKPRCSRNGCQNPVPT